MDLKDAVAAAGRQCGQRAAAGIDPKQAALGADKPSAVAQTPDGGDRARLGPLHRVGAAAARVDPEKAVVGAHQPASVIERLKNGHHACDGLRQVAEIVRDGLDAVEASVGPEQKAAGRQPPVHGDLERFRTRHLLNLLVLGVEKVDASGPGPVAIPDQDRLVRTDLDYPIDWPKRRPVEATHQ